MSSYRFGDVLRPVFRAYLFFDGREGLRSLKIKYLGSVLFGREPVGHENLSVGEQYSCAQFRAGLKPAPTMQIMCRGLLTGQTELSTVWGVRVY